MEAYVSAVALKLPLSTVATFAKLPQKKQPLKRDSIIFAYIKYCVVCHDYYYIYICTYYHEIFLL